MPLPQRCLTGPTTDPRSWPGWCSQDPAAAATAKWMYTAKDSSNLLVCLVCCSLSAKPGLMHRIRLLQLCIGDLTPACASKVRVLRPWTQPYKLLQALKSPILQV